jgi:hypothetical protein
MSVALTSDDGSVAPGILDRQKPEIGLAEISEPTRTSEVNSRPSASKLSKKSYISFPLGRGARIRA